MKRIRFLYVFRHSFTMVRRTIKSYAMLSVTIILSFSLLLGYLLYTDASLYNQYKETFLLPRELLKVSSSYGANTEKMNIFAEKAVEIGNTYCMPVFTASAFFNTHGVSKETGAEIATSVGAEILCIPSHAWGIHDYLNELEIIWLDGESQENITLGPDEMLMNEGIYYALGLDKMETPVYSLSPSGMNGDVIENGSVYTMRVVGLLRDTIPLQAGKVEGVFDIEANPDYRIRFVVSAGTLNPTKEANGIWFRHTMVWTDSPEQVAQLAEQLNCNVDSVYQQQNEALEHIRNEKGNKAIIACALLLLLGINLYSSFTNALNDRKFEIGVKRAIGASAGSIVRQFLYESVIVMVANTVISIAVVADVFIVYKYVYERIPDLYGNYNTWTIYISPHSIAMFGLCAVTLTVVFSLIFAYKSTRVEIVQYLKAE